MKKLFAISCAALLASILALSMTVSIAFAETNEGDTSWSVVLPAPGTITQEVSTKGLGDYAVTYYTDSENPSVSYYKYAFANGNEITIYSCYDAESEQIIDIGEADGSMEYSGGTIETVSLPYIVQQMEYSEDGDLYCKDIFSNLYVVRAGSTACENVESDSFAFSEYYDFLGMVSDGENLYRIDGDGKLNVLNIETWKTATYPDDDENFTEVETFKSLKKIDGTVYVLGDSLYMAENGEILPVSFIYEDYDTELSIEVGNTFRLLGETADGINFAEIKEDALLIPVDLDESGTTFKIPSRIRRYSDVQKDAGTAYAQALLASDEDNYCSRGATSYGAVLIYYGKQTYLTYREKVTLRLYSTSPLNETFYALDDAGVYSMPYPSDSTRTGTVSKGGEVTATEVVDNPDISFYDAFYKIEYTNGDGETSTGYVLAAMFSVYDFDDDNPELMSAQLSEATYDDNVTLCVIIIVLAAVLLVAAIYLTIALTSTKRKK